MDQEKIGNIIKKLRKDNNLTQKDLADKLGVTFQAVSKWENGKNIPDISTLRQISKEFKIDISSILDGNLKRKKQINIMLILVTIISFIFLYMTLNKDNGYNFKTLSANCNNFNISGSIVYNKEKSTIYISKLEYCGGNDNLQYKKIESILYESTDNLEKKINQNLVDDSLLTLEDYLKNLSIYIDNYNSICKNFITSNLYIELNATTEDDKVISYKIPLKLENNDC